MITNSIPNNRRNIFNSGFLSPQLEGGGFLFFMVNRKSGIHFSRGTPLCVQILVLYTLTISDEGASNKTIFILFYWITFGSGKARGLRYYKRNFK